MDPRERWQTLQGKLTAARSAVDAGDLTAALREVNAALDIDPDFLAAQALRDRVLQMTGATAVQARRRQPAVAPSALAPAVANPSPVHTAPSRAVTVRAVASAPVVPAPLVDAPVVVPPIGGGLPPSVNIRVDGALGEGKRPCDSEPVTAAPVEPLLDPAISEPLVDPAISKEAASESSEASAGYVKFEQRARRRRVDRRIDAARDALDRGRIRAAAAALDEVIDLDPNQPELAELTARFDELRRETIAPRRGPWVFAVAVFSAAVFGASWLQDGSTRILSRQKVWAAPLVAGVAPLVTIAQRLAVVVDPPAEEPREPATLTTGLRPRAPEPDVPATEPPVLVHPGAPVPLARTAAAVEAAQAAPPADVPNVVHAAREVPAPAPIPPPAPAPARVVAATPAAAPISTPPATTAAPANPDAVDDSRLVRRALQRYRSAYEELDARSAQEVWPAVNQTALARAFDGLQSQSLTFDACDVNLRGEAATATCRGSARYVPKVGSRDPRVESLVWNFKLHKAGSDWQIDSARAER